MLLQLLLLCALLPGSTPTGGLFQLRLHSFEIQPPPPSVQFRICVKHYQVVIDPYPPCYIGEALSKEVMNSGELGLRFDFEFKFRWPGTFSLIIEPLSPETHSTLSRLSIQQWLDTGPEYKYYNYTTTPPATFRYSYRVRCLEGYYGPACDKICRGRDDKFGHYTCDTEGRIVCLEGWEGEYCERAHCPPSSCLHGSCSTPSNCSCHPGWSGPSCSACLPHPGCKHGSCSRAPWDCECEEGWGGLFCNQDLNYCTNHRPCRNGGTCFNTGQGSYTCVCRRGWGGADCGVAGGGVDEEDCGECLNGGSCLGGICVCGAGWRGKKCEEGFCAGGPCRNGGTCSPPLGRCLCPPGTHPPFCSTTLCSSAHCSNHSYCVEATGECQCEPGFAGPTCSEEVDMCRAGPCANGGRCVSLGGARWRCDCKDGFGGPDCSEVCGGGCDCRSSAPCRCCNTTELSIAMLQSELSTEHVALVIAVSIATPLLVLFAVGLLIIIKRRRREELLRNEEVARRQNEENAIASGVQPKGLDRWMVVNTWGEEAPKCSNLRGEGREGPGPGGGRKPGGTRV